MIDVTLHEEALRRNLLLSGLISLHILQVVLVWYAIWIRVGVTHLDRLDVEFLGPGYLCYEAMKILGGKSSNPARHGLLSLHTVWQPYACLSIDAVEHILFFHILKLIINGSRIYYHLTFIQC